MTDNINKICLGCPHLNRACPGTKNNLWSGCVLKNQAPKTAEHYIKRMTEILTEAKNDTTL